MSTIEQAAKRLEQLRQAGVDVGTAGASTPAMEESAPPHESVPLRVARELDAHGGVDLAAARARRAEPARRPEPAAVPIRHVPLTRVEIDLARLSANGYVTPAAVRSRLAEEFRVIKRPLLTNAHGKSAAPIANANRIMITSALPGEGKTYVSLNLAMSIAMELDTSVMLVDADASRPAVLDRLGLEPSRGLFDLLADPALTLDECVLATNVERLSILPAGTEQAQATELLASDTMTRLVDQLSSDDPRRIVLFDTPPLLSASEARVLAAHMGQVVLIVAADDTPQGSVAEALATIENCPVVVTLLNKVSPGNSGNYYGSYGAYDA